MGNPTATPPASPSGPPYGQPPRTNQAAIAVLVGVLVVIGLVVGIGIYTVAAVIHNTHIRETGQGDQKIVQIQSPVGNLQVNGDGDNAKVDIDSPFGSLHVNPTPDPSRLDMDVFPGATLVTSRRDSPFHRDDLDNLDAMDGVVRIDPGFGRYQREDSAPGAQIQITVAGQAFSINVAEFRTTASPDAVLHFYNDEFSRYGAVEHHHHGRTDSIEVKLSSHNARTVAVESANDGTHFVLVRVAGANPVK